MTLFSVPVTITASIYVAAPDAAAARREARRYAEAMDHDGHFKDGWNDIQRQKGGPIIDDVSGFNVEAVELDEIEEMPPRWVVEPQRNVPPTPALIMQYGLTNAETRMTKCEEHEAQSWAVLERDAADMADATLVEDYPTRAAAEAAVQALEAGLPLPDPIWPNDEDENPPAAVIADALEMLDCVTFTDREGDNAGRFTVTNDAGETQRYRFTVLPD